MRKVEKIYNVYNFNELSEKIQEQVLKNYYKDGEEYSFQSDIFYQDTIKELSKLNFKNLEINYSLSYCQGDGFSFTSDNMYSGDIIKFLEIISENKKSEYSFTNQLIKELHQLYKKLDIKINKNIIENFDCVLSFNRFNHSYVHERSVNVEIENNQYNINSDEDIIITKKQEKYISLIEKFFKQAYLIICKDCENKGYDVIYHTMTIQEFSEYANSQGWEYSKNGILE